MRFTNILAAIVLIGCNGVDSSSSKLSDQTTQSGDCTLTQGYWKNHPDAWPVSSLKLGKHTYSKDDLIAILETPVKGNGLIQLAHQLIAAKLNIAAGASDAAIHATIADADALIGNLVVGTDSLSPARTSALTDKLDEFNSGVIGPGHCGESCSDEGSGSCGPTCGNGKLETGEQCDDGNTTSGDGCSSTCTTEGPKCGNGIVESGEGCDDGNTTSGDGCSSTCQCEPTCGNGKLEAGEQCDDGNTTSGDGCSSTCTTEGPVCGNGKVESGEQCDDGNTTSGDGCSSTCQCECPH